MVNVMVLPPVENWMAGSSIGITALGVKFNVTEPVTSRGNGVPIVTATRAGCPAIRGKGSNSKRGEGVITVVTSDAELFARFKSPSPMTATVWFRLDVDLSFTKMVIL